LPVLCATNPSASAPANDDDQEEWGIFDQKLAKDVATRRRKITEASVQIVKEGSDPLPTASTIERLEDLTEMPYSLIVTREA
jgi:hypothetical protein